MAPPTAPRGFSRMHQFLASSHPSHPSRSSESGPSTRAHAPAHDLRITQVAQRRGSPRLGLPRGIWPIHKRLQQDGEGVWEPRRDDLSEDRRGVAQQDLAGALHQGPEAAHAQHHILHRRPPQECVTPPSPPTFAISPWSMRFFVDSLHPQPRCGCTPPYADGSQPIVTAVTGAISDKPNYVWPQLKRTHPLPSTTLLIHPSPTRASHRPAPAIFGVLGFRRTVSALGWARPSKARSHRLVAIELAFEVLLALQHFPNTPAAFPATPCNSTTRRHIYHNTP